MYSQMHTHRDSEQLPAIYLFRNTYKLVISSFPNHTRIFTQIHYYSHTHNAHRYRYIYRQMYACKYTHTNPENPQHQQCTLI